MVHFILIHCVIFLLFLQTACCFNHIPKQPLFFKRHDRFNSRLYTPSNYDINHRYTNLNSEVSESTHSTTSTSFLPSPPSPPTDNETICESMPPSPPPPFSALSVSDGSKIQIVLLSVMTFFQIKTYIVISQINYKEDFVLLSNNVIKLSEIVRAAFLLFVFGYLFIAYIKFAFK